jgi:hypothetical protein
MYLTSKLPRGAEVVEDRAEEAQLHLTKWRLSYRL